MVGLCGVLQKLSRGAWGGHSGRLWRRNTPGRDGLRTWSVKDTEVTKEEDDSDCHLTK